MTMSAALSVRQTWQARQNKMAILFALAPHALGVGRWAPISCG